MNNQEIVHWLNGYMAAKGATDLTAEDMQIIKDELQKVTPAPDVVQPKYAPVIPTPWPIYPPGVRSWPVTSDMAAP